MPSLTVERREALGRALEAGLRPRATGKPRGLIVTTPGLSGRRAGYKTPIDREGGVTTSGTYFYNQLQEEPPNRQYDPT